MVVWATSPYFKPWFNLALESQLFLIAVHPIFGIQAMFALSKKVQALPFHYRVATVERKETLVLYSWGHPSKDAQDIVNLV